MARLGGFVALTAIALTTSGHASADGALAVGITANLARDGIAVGAAINQASADAAQDAALRRCHNFKRAAKAAAQCQPVGTFKDECYAVSLDPTPGMPGAGWAIAATRAQAEEQALDKCKATAGSARREACRIEESKCDGM